ncbi:hypothetical protein [Streptomyces sp. NPDC020965]|uniref:hypothetical protein n=1 Tax=Streptomyces sp. NPDC020965 TaxID=3365105 RepID=UPI0037BC134B
MRKLLVFLMSLVASVGLAALPSSASATALASLSGSSYNNCARVSGDFSWTYRGNYDGYPGYSTSGTAHIRRGNSACSLTPVFQFKGWVYSGTSSWVPINTFRTLSTGIGSVDLSFDNGVTRLIEFRICNRQPDGRINGCGPVS